MKKSALIKFMDIQSAQNAAAFNETIMDNPRIKIIYNVGDITG